MIYKTSQRPLLSNHIHNKANMATQQRNSERLALFQEVAQALPDDTAHQNFTCYRNLSEHHINSVQGELHAFQQPHYLQSDRKLQTQLSDTVSNIFWTIQPCQQTPMTSTEFRFNLPAKHASSIETLALFSHLAAGSFPMHHHTIMDTSRSIFAIPWLKEGVQIYLHQLTLIADHREDELKAAIDPERDMQVSHLCHEGRCFNPAHLVVEDSNLNKEQNTCQGHYIIKHGGMSWHPCAHAREGVRKRCILPEMTLGDGWFSNSD